MPALFVHVDMDAFFAAVEIRADPRLAGRPLVVGGGPGGRGVVTTASYPARRFGVRSGMSLAEALRRCPTLLVLPVNGARYVHESLRILQVLDRLSPRVEAASIDEAYLEFPPVEPGLWEARARDWGERVREAVREASGLSCSVGVAVNKLQTKMATPLGKPGGVTVLPPGRFLRVFAAEPVSRIPGVGPRTTEALARLGIRTIGDLARSDRNGGATGVGRELARRARGRDASDLVPDAEAPPPASAGHETTFPRDVADPRWLRATVWMLADRVARRLRRGDLAAGTVVVRFKVGSKRGSRQRRLLHPVREAEPLARIAWDLLESVRRGRPLRLVGVAGASLVPPVAEPSLFPEDLRRQRMLETGDRIRDRFGESGLLPAATFKEDPW